MSATYHKFEDFALRIGQGIHHLHAAGDTLKIYLTNNTPNLATHTVKADLAGITEGAGFGYDPADVQNDYTAAAGTGTMTCVDKVWTAGGGSFGPFRYIVEYNDTATNDNLIAEWDYGSSITVNDGETFTVDFGASVLTIA